MHGKARRTTHLRSLMLHEVRWNLRDVHAVSTRKNVARAPPHLVLSCLEVLLKIEQDLLRSHARTRTVKGAAHAPRHPTHRIAVRPEGHSAAILPGTPSTADAMRVLINAVFALQRARARNVHPQGRGRAASTVGRS